MCTDTIDYVHLNSAICTTRLKRSLIDLKDTQKIPKGYPKDTHINISQDGRRGKESHG